jgi:hypothetical protein
MSRLRRVRERAVTELQSLPRRLKRRLGRARVERHELELQSTVGYRLHTRLLVPSGQGPLDAVVLVPGTDDPGTVFEGWSQPVNALELASRGLLVCHYDPAGRGRSWGDEDYGGPEHQDDLDVVIRHVAALPRVRSVGVLSISLGLATAAGCLAELRPPAAWLLDWEGPCDREIICAGGAIMAPALGHTLEDEVYWRPREATRHVGDLPCAYVRIQSERDHAQPGELRHALRMIEAAAAGGVPFRLNDHDEGENPAHPRWIPGGRLAANKALLAQLDRLTR